ncbi:MAG: hypothetical protein ACE366_29455 [Bradymonadia bacterium]
MVCTRAIAALISLTLVACDDAENTQQTDAEHANALAQDADAHSPDGSAVDGDVVNDAFAPPDEGAPADALPRDARIPDAEPSDARAPDLGTPDAATPDAGPPDARVDLPLGEPCGPDELPCEDGTRCVGEAGAGTCRATCDPTAVSPCEGTAACIAFDAERPEAGGWCWPSPQCSTEDRSMCPLGDRSSCITLPPLSLCARPGFAETGETCVIDPEGVRPAEELCRAGLFCHYGRCKAPCDALSQCGEGEICIDYGPRLRGTRYQFCHRPCDPLEAAGCGPAAECVVVDQQNGAMVGACLISGGRSSASGQQGDPCTPSDRVLGGTCAPGHVCAAVGPDWLHRCTRWCDLTLAEPCRGNSACVFDVLSQGRTATGPLDHVGLCIGECDPLAMVSDCPGGALCTPVHEGRDDRGRPTLAGWCRPRPEGPLAGPGQPCTVDALTGGSNCLHRYSCVASAEGEDPRCLPLCRLGDGFDDCPPPEACQPAAGNQLQGLRGIGVCSGLDF